MSTHAKLLFQSAFYAALAAGLFACGDEGVNDSRPGSDRAASIRLVPVMEPTHESALARRAGGGTAERLESFQVAVEAVFLAREIAITGSAWSNPQGTLELYSMPALMTPAHDLLTAANALDAANDPFYIDFMSAAGRARIGGGGGSFTEQNLGDYNFVVVNWAYPFRVRGSVDLGDGRVVYTKPGAYDSSAHSTHASSDMMTGPAETAVVIKPNGGTWFRLLRPLTLVDADLNTSLLVRDTTRRDSAGRVIDTLVPAGQLNVMLVFNPDDFLSAWDTSFTGGTGSMETEITGPGGIGNIHVPFLDATVVPFRTGEEVWRETYLFAGANPREAGAGFRMRFELYTVGDNVVAASLRGLTGPAGELPLESLNIFFAENGSGGTLDLRNHARESIISGFHRQAAVGGTGTADLNMILAQVNACAFTLVEKRKMN